MWMVLAGEFPTNTWIEEEDMPYWARADTFVTQWLQNKQETGISHVDLGQSLLP